jgi:hypothetical protein
MSETTVEKYQRLSGADATTLLGYIGTYMMPLLSTVFELQTVSSEDWNTAVETDKSTLIKLHRALKDCVNAVEIAITRVY